MKLQDLLVLLCICMVLLLGASPQSASAAASLSIVSVGNGMFVIQAAGLEGVAAIDMQVVYDAGALASPRVVAGEMVPGDAGFISNTGIPGEVRILINRRRALPASGRIASIGFVQTTSTPGRIYSFVPRLVSVGGMPMLVGASIVNPSPVPPAEGEGGAGGTGSTGTGGTGIPDTGGIPGDTAGSRSGGSVTLTLGGGEAPRETPAEKNRQVNEQASAPSESGAGQGEPAVREESREPEPAPSREERRPDAAKEETLRYSSVLERFRLYTGGRSPGAFTALFAPLPGQKVRQEPDVALSDGETVVRIRVDLPHRLKKPPIFLFSEAKMQTLRQEPDGSWLVETLPAAGSIEAKLTIMYDGSLMEYPLVVAPPLAGFNGREGPLGEADFVLFLKERGTEKKPAHDLDGDKARTYRDDYIFTANFLASGQKDLRERTVTPSGKKGGQGDQGRD